MASSTSHVSPIPPKHLLISSPISVLSATVNPTATRRSNQPSPEKQEEQQHRSPTNTATPPLKQTQAPAMPPRRFAFTRTEDAFHPDTARAALSEIIATAIFVFAAEGSVLSLCRLYKDTSTAGGLTVVAIAHALAFAAAVSLAINISGGHVNPAVTLGALAGGRISFIRALYYWIAQLLGAVVASLLLRATTGGMRPLGFSVASGVGELQAVVLEAVLTFGLVYTFYAVAIDPKRGGIGSIAPILLGFVVGANMLAGGVFDGAAMNPARAFGPALVGWRWGHQWVYWVGPFIGAALAGVVYEFLVIPAEPPHPHHQPLAPEDY